MNDNQAVLAICLPTCNRAFILSRLLASYLLLPASLANKVQFCISNNASTDTTLDIINSYSGAVCIVNYTQKSRVSFSQNARAALQLASAKWRCLIGDDDILNCNYLEILCDKLESLDPSTWVLVPTISHQDNKIIHLSFLCRSNQKIKSNLFFHGVSDFGFIGSHIIPASSIKRFLYTPALCDEDYWFHQLLFFAHLGSKLNVAFFPLPYCSISHSGFSRPYSCMLWMRLWFSRFNAIYRLSITTRSLFLFIIFLRTYASFSQVKEILKLILLYGNTSFFRAQVISRGGFHLPSLLFLCYTRIFRLLLFGFFRNRR